MISDFKTLMALDLSKWVSKKPTFKRNDSTGKFEKTGVELDYINWADCLELLYENGAKKVLFGNVRSAQDHPLFLLNGTLPFIRVYVDVDGERAELDFPLIDGATDIKIEKADQSDIHNATQRAFVKCVAINWGLGLSLWQKEEKAAPVTLKIDPMTHDLWEIKKRMELLATSIMQKKGWSIKELCEAIGMKENIYSSTMISGFNNIGLAEQRMREIK